MYIYIIFFNVYFFFFFSVHVISLSEVQVIKCQRSGAAAIDPPQMWSPRAGTDEWEILDDTHNSFPSPHS